MTLQRTKMARALMGIFAVSIAAYFCVHLYAQSTGDLAEDFPRKELNEAPLGLSALGELAPLDSSVQLDKHGRTPMEIRFLWKPGMNPEEPGLIEMDLMDDKRTVFRRVQEEILRQYAATDDASGRDKLKSFLQQAVLEEFAFRQVKRRTELDRLAKELKQLENLHSSREKQKASIVAARAEQLIRDKEGLGWGTTGSRPSSNDDADPP